MIAHPDQLRALSAVVEHGTFDAAASALHLTPSAISQRIRALEQQVGKVLLLRSKPAVATEPGRAVLRLARQIALLEQETAVELGLDDPQGARIPLVVNADSLATWVLPALATVPGVSFEILVDDQDHTTAWLREGVAMAAITSDTSPVAGCRVTPLGIMRYHAMASPDFRDRWFADGLTADSLARAPMLNFNRKDSLQDRFLALHSPETPLDPPCTHVPSSSEFVKATELGLGWAMLPDIQTDAGRAAGRLVVLDEANTVDVSLHWQQWAVGSAALDAVATALRGTADRVLR
ncbi:LysR family transcriptional regulator (chromosome initiation inhibitor) [Arthrobacter woluwensis]|uniref:LysR family transcriptional regulator ArgP n=1 Tax=Arthrobacter woluwensis TaxID=156980 RepID=UPI002783EE18|nr:LysR family transcriptional regulator ArgP [Arthrobacter woluwensis]MDQ0708750.1 LysR family transcriptional regulator (chromosome initiation inhibitor) [Arthrobacter woluwensis]